MKLNQVEFITDEQQLPSVGDMDIYYAVDGCDKLRRWDGRRYLFVDITQDQYHKFYRSHHTAYVQLLLPWWVTEAKRVLSTKENLDTFRNVTTMKLLKRANELNLNFIGIKRTGERYSEAELEAFADVIVREDAVSFIISKFQEMKDDTMYRFYTTTSDMI